MKCSACAVSGVQYEMEEAKTSYLGVLRNGNYVIVEHVPCLRCPNCGEAYFRLSVMERIDAILAEWEEMSDRVRITDYAEAA